MGPLGAGRRMELHIHQGHLRNLRRVGQSPGSLLEVGQILGTLPGPGVLPDSHPAGVGRQGSRLVEGERCRGILSQDSRLRRQLGSHRPKLGIRPDSHPEKNTHNC